MSKALGTKRVLNSNEEKEQLEELRRGPWTQEEDTLLSNYVTFHGEGRWNLLAKSSGKFSISMILLITDVFN